jgi:hypothetical protein
MTVGIDVGISTTKIAALDGGVPRGFCTVPVVPEDPVASASGALGSLLRDQGRPLSSIRKLAVTGVGSAPIGEELLGLACTRVSEFQATGCGGLFLSGLERAIVVSMGTGTSIVRAGGDGIRHLGGSGVGGGTLLGLSRAILHTTDVPAILEAASAGNLANVDLRIVDLLPDNLENLPGFATASNFGGWRAGDESGLRMGSLAGVPDYRPAGGVRRQEPADIVLAGRTIPQAGRSSPSPRCWPFIPGPVRHRPGCGPVPLIDSLPGFQYR